jgi:hypothetical protein
MPADDEPPGDDKPRKQRPWFLDPRAIVAFLGALVALILGLSQLLAKLDDPPANVSAEYVVDVSRGMNGKIGRNEKLPAVAAEVVSHVENTPSLSTALRFSGPACTQEYQEPDVSFAEDNGDQFTDALRGRDSGGDSNFANAIAHAVSDFTGRSDAAESANKSLFIFVGGRDTCANAPSATIGRVLRNLSGTNLQLNLKFVGVNVPPEVRQILRRAQGVARRLDFTSEVVIARRPSQLEGVLPGNDCSAREVEYEEGC